MDYEIQKYGVQNTENNALFRRGATNATRGKYAACRGNRHFLSGGQLVFPEGVKKSRNMSQVRISGWQETLEGSIAESILSDIMFFQGD